MCLPTRLYSHHRQTLEYASFMVRLLWNALLVLAPHPDDHEALGAAGRIQRVRASGVLHHLVHHGKPARR